jgi:hypothetical protein
MTIVRMHYHNKRLSLEQAFMLGNEMIAAGEPDQPRRGLVGLRDADRPSLHEAFAATSCSRDGRMSTPRTSLRCFTRGVGRRSSR